MNIRSVITTLLGIILLAASGAAQEKKLQVVTFEYPPLMGSSNMSKDGMLVELLYAALEAEHISHQIQFLPTKRCIAMINNNEVPAFISMIEYFSPDEQHLIEDIPLARIRFMAFYLTNRFPRGILFRTPADLKDYTVGVLAGGITNRVAEASGLKVTQTSSLELIFSMLLANRFEIGTANDLAIQNELAHRFKGKESPIAMCEGVPFVAANASIILSRRNPDYGYYSARIKAGLAEIARNGTWMSILEKYYGAGKVPEEAQIILESYPH